MSLRLNDFTRGDLRDEDKSWPGQHESMCNPISQADFLNRVGCELNIILGLCVGDGSLFLRYSKGLATTLAAKDRVLAHNRWERCI